MRNIIIVWLLLFFSLFPSLFAEDVSLEKYQYWFDDNHQDYNEGNMNGNKSGNFEFDVDASQLRIGLHTLHFRFSDNFQKWSSPLCWLFFSNGKIEQNKLSKCQYWFDNNHQNLIEKGMNGGISETLEFDTEQLEYGLHTLHLRFSDNNGKWSTPTEWLFFSNGKIDPKQPAKIEYWFNDLSSERVTETIKETGITLFTNASNLKDGLHKIVYRISDNQGNWSIPSQWSFYRLPESFINDTVVTIEYWLDSGYDKPFSISAHSGVNLFDIETENLSEGLHTLTYRTKTKCGNYGNPGTWLFYKLSQTQKASGIQWCKYWWNDREDLATIEIFDPISNPLIFSKEIALPIYAQQRGTLTARLNIVFCDDLGAVSNAVYSDIEYPDIFPPVSQISVDSESVNESVNLSWSAEDEELSDFNIYVSENDLPYVLWLPNTTSTKAIYKGEAGKSYRFTITARDKSNNIEKFDASKYVKVLFNK